MNRPEPGSNDSARSYLEWKGWSQAKFGDLTPTGRAYFDAELRRSGKNLSTRLKVLEIGFGNGNFMAYARDRGWEIIGAESNSLLIESAAAAGFSAIPSSALASLTAEQFDLIVAFDVLEHIEQSALPGFLCDLLRLLRDDGVLLARFPNGDSPFGLVNFNGDLTHVSFIGSEKARMLAKMARADIVFLGGEAQPLIAGSLSHTLHSVLTRPLKAAVEWLVHWIFFPRRDVFFLPLNLVLAVRPEPRHRTR